MFLRGGVPEFQPTVAMLFGTLLGPEDLLKLHRNALVMVFLAAAVASALSAWLAGPERGPMIEPSPGSTRIASLAPSITSVLVFIGAGEELVAISDYCRVDYPTGPIPVVGTALTPDRERLIRVAPGAILARKAGAVPIEILSGIAPTALLPWSSVTDLAASVRAIGEICSRQEAAEKLAQGFEARLLREASESAPRALLLLGGGATGSELWVIKPNSLHGALLPAAGLRNAIDGPLRGAPTISLEELVRLDPELIITLVPSDQVSGVDRERLLHRFDALDSLEAVRSRSIGVIADGRCLDEGPELIDLADRLTEVARTLLAGRDQR